MSLRSGEITRLQAAQQQHLGDTCVILSYSAADNAYNLPEPTFTPGAPTDCGFKGNSRREVQDGGQVIVADAELRLASDTTITQLDRVRLTHKAGQELASPLTFDVIGHPETGPSGIVVTLRRIATDG